MGIKENICRRQHTSHLSNDTLGGIDRVRPHQAQQGKYLPGSVRYDGKRHLALLQLLPEENGRRERVDVDMVVPWKVSKRYDKPL